MQQVFVWLAFMIMMSNSWAENENSTLVSKTPTQFSYYSKTTSEALNYALTDKEKSLARQWELTDDDWVKYKNIMAGPRGIWSPGLDPLTALGVMETDPEERRRYAEIWMKMEIRRSELELAFEVERMAVSERLLQGRPLVNNQGWKEHWSKTQESSTYDVLMFAQVGCVEKCTELFNAVFESTGTDDKTRLNIYFPDGTSAEDIGKWAQSVGIDPEIVRRRKITLNFDQGEFQRYHIEIHNLPEVRVVNLKTGQVNETFVRW